MQWFMSIQQRIDQARMSLRDCSTLNLSFHAFRNSVTEGGRALEAVCALKLPEKSLQDGNEPWLQDRVGPDHKAIVARPDRRANFARGMC